MPPGDGDGRAGAAACAGAQPLFQVSEVLAERFRVVRLLGRGGMGEVYEVDDLELGERVAVKTLRSHLLASDRALALLRNEVQLARRVTHPNVCRVFDVFRHRRVAGGVSESVALVTMERLPGETLAQRLERDGPLEPAQALPILRQIAEALDAAHTVGVVHRDLKSANVVLVDGVEGPRAVVADFGIAAAVGEAAAAGGPPCGTVPYMAPEQRAGAATGPAADLYAFGVLVREIVAGRAKARDDQDAELPPDWAAVVAACLAEAPTARPASALEVCRRLTVVPGRHRWAARSAVAAALVLVATLAGLARPPRPAQPASADGVPIAVEPPAATRPALALAVAPAVAGGAPEQVRRWPALAVSMLLTDELEALVPDLFPGTAPFASGSAAVDSDSGAVAANVTVVQTPGGRLRLDLEIDTGEERPRTISRGATPRSLPEATADLAAAIAAAMGSVPEPAAARRRARYGDDPAALEALARGLAAQDDARPVQALEYLSEAVALEPEAFEPRLALTEALLHAGRRTSARDQAAVVRRLAEDLGVEQRLAAAALEAHASGDYGGAAAEYAELVRRRPHRLDWGLRHVLLLASARRTAQAAQELKALARRLPVAARDPRYMLLQGAVAIDQNDYARAIESARSARRRAEELGLPGLAFNAVEHEFHGRRLVGRNEELEQTAIEALALARAAADPWQLGRALRIRSVAHLRAGEPEARRVLEAALSEGRRVGDMENVLWCLNNLAHVAQLDGDVARAEELLRDALDIVRQSGNQWRILFVRQNLAMVLAQRGRLTEADDQAQEVLAGARTIASAEMEAEMLALRAEIALERNELQEAARLVAAFRELATETEGSYVGRTLALAADLGRRRGELVEARLLVARALAALDDGGTAIDRAFALEVKAEVESAVAGPAIGRQAMQDALAATHDLGAVYLEARIGRKAARLERLLGNLPAARRMLAGALAVNERSGCELELAHDRLELAKLHGAEGDDGGAVAAARQALADYRRLSHREGIRASRAFLARAPKAEAAESGEEQG